MKTLAATFFIALSAASAGVHAQNAARPGTGSASGPAPAEAACPRSAQDLTVQTLVGRWQVRIDGQPAATAELHPHPDYAGVRGTITRGTATAQLAGDIDDEGQLALDESEDGHAISASWSLALQPASCGKEFKGTWQHAGDEAKQPVAMTRISPSAP